MVTSSVIRKVGFWDSAMPIWVVFGGGLGSFRYGLVFGLSAPYGSGRVRDWLSRLVW